MSVILILVLLTASTLPISQVSPFSLNNQKKGFHIQKQGCFCDSVLRPLFYRAFLPPYMTCGGDYVCILANLRWINVGGKFVARNVLKTLQATNQHW